MKPTVGQWSGYPTAVVMGRRRTRGMRSFAWVFRGLRPSRLSMGRLGTAEEVADVIVFIASPRAHWINGRNIPVDGLEQPHAPLDGRPY